MPTFSEFHKLNQSQHQLDFVDISNEFDMPVYIDPYAIEIRSDIWANEASEYIRSFFLEVLDALRKGNQRRADYLMSHLHEPKETFLGVSKGKPKGRGVGSKQGGYLIESIKKSKAYSSGILSDISELALFVDNFNRDKVSDLTTNIIRNLLVNYTKQICDLYNIDVHRYSSPPMWNIEKLEWISEYVELPRINDDPIILVPKYIVRRSLSLDADEFYNKQITDFLVAENLDADTSLVRVLKNGRRTVYKSEVRDKYKKSKTLIADIVVDNPNLLDLYKKIAKNRGCLTVFNDDKNLPSINTVARMLIDELIAIKPGRKDADKYHNVIMGSLTVLFYPYLTHPKKEWDVNEGRKRIDLVYVNAADMGFFAQRRNAHNTCANIIVVECKNYSDDIANEELDQLLGRFDDNRGKFGILTCREVDDIKTLEKRCLDMSIRSRGYIVTLTDAEIIEMLEAKANLNDDMIENMMQRKFRELLK